MMELSKEQNLEIYHYLRLTRSLEEKLENLLKQGKIKGGLFRSLGQEGTAVASAYALDKSQNDMISPLTRDMGAMLVMGATPREVFSSYLAKVTSPNRGRDQNIHFTDLERGFIGTISPLGTMVGVMNGVMLATKLQGKKTVGMVYIGDGAMSTGMFHEAANFAAVQQLPLVIIGEFNGFAYSTPIAKQSRVENLADRVKAYGLPTEIVDGNDVLAVYEAARRAVDRARSGGGPSFVEAKTFRMRGHAAHDNQSYVAKELLEEWRRKDPIDRFIRHLTGHHLATQEELNEIDRKIDASLEADLAWTESQSIFKGQEAAEGVFA